MKKIIVVIDGYCVMCNFLALWISRRDKKNQLRFTNFDSNYVKKNYPEIKSGRSVVLINEVDQMIFEKSNAVIQCLRVIEYKINLVIFIELFPRIIRDFIYNIVAKYRYLIFGKKERCSVTSKVPDTKILN